MRLLNKTALITGAVQGIGLACAELFIKEGATVILTDVNHEAGETIAKALGSQAVYHPLNVQKEQQWLEIEEYIRKNFPSFNVLVNNAGIMGFVEKMGPQDPEYASYESWKKIHEINLDSVFLGCRLGIRLMKEKGGSIINMSSRSGVVGIPRAAAYASSKAAIRNHTKSVALYCASEEYPIRCNSLHPAAILTPLWEVMLGDDAKTRLDAIKKISKDIPLKCMGNPKDVAYAAVYLASDESAYITGAELSIDGGILAGTPAAPQKQKE
ncbi:MAG TPA: SDR family oxidoreductase [Alphaproteobacteria bacterium]|nr:SDR family oxidoreductase [Alphaproteobacteria bacterium]